MCDVSETIYDIEEMDYIERSGKERIVQQDAIEDRVLPERPQGATCAKCFFWAVWPGVLSPRDPRNSPCRHHRVDNFRV